MRSQRTAAYPSLGAISTTNPSTPACACPWVPLACGTLRNPRPAQLKTDAAPTRNGTTSPGRFKCNDACVQRKDTCMDAALTSDIGLANHAADPNNNTTATKLMSTLRDRPCLCEGDQRGNRGSNAPNNPRQGSRHTARPVSQETPQNG
jgi:hypothetical protein